MTLFAKYFIAFFPIWGICLIALLASGYYQGSFTTNQYLSFVAALVVTFLLYLIHSLISYLLKK